MDDFSRESLAALADTSISGVRVVRLLEELALTHGLPQTLVSDNGPEFTSRAMLTWAQHRGVTPHLIDPGKLTRLSVMESRDPAWCSRQRGAHCSLRSTWGFRLRSFARGIAECGV